MPGLAKSAATENGLSVTAYSGDRCVMLAFDLDERSKEHLAGFAVRRKFQNKGWQWLSNRISFDSNYTSSTTAETRKWYPSNKAPFQKFWWVDFPPEDAYGAYQYEVSVMRFTEEHSSELAQDQALTISVDCSPFKQGNFELAFTRGYLSSQAYADRFKNAAIRPEPKSLDYDTDGFTKQYEWLGAHARKTIVNFLTTCFENPEATLDVMVYDLDEPDIVRALCCMESRLRIAVDNSASHSKNTALEPLAVERLIQSAGTDNVRTGDFSRYQHNKVFIMKVKGKPVRVLTGSTNFSVTGLYVNANHVAVFDDAEVAKLYQAAFDAGFNGKLKTPSFVATSISKSEFEISRDGLPKSFFSFAPHAAETFSLDRLEQAITDAKGSVLFAVMALVGRSKVLDSLRQLHSEGKVFSYGITDNPGGKDGEKDTALAAAVPGITVYTPSKPGVLVKSYALNKLVPFPFSKELQLGLTHLVHHKFVVIDFNGTNPIVFFGSSNLAGAGEESNGDNLIAIYDIGIATVFAIEAVRLVDHYAFREVLAKASNDNPIRLKFDDEDWARRYYDTTSLKYKERKLFSKSSA